MLGNRICKNAGLALTGFVAGIALMLVLGSAKDRHENEKEILPKSTFGDLRITTMPLEQDDIHGAIAIYKGDIPLIYLYRNDSNEVHGFGITNGKNGILAVGQLSKSGISNFLLYGNEVHDAQRTVVLVMEASDKPGVWRHVSYGLSVPEYNENRVPRHRFVGDVYEDLDCDGRFDAKEVFNDKSVVVSESIFINGEWRELGRLDSNGQFTKRRGSFDEKDLTAFTQEVGSGKKTYFDFVWGKGWQERSEKPGRERSAKPGITQDQSPGVSDDGSRPIGSTSEVES
jgi:hypothetical protein